MRSRSSAGASLPTRLGLIFLFASMGCDDGDGQPEPPPDTRVVDMAEMAEMADVAIALDLGPDMGPVVDGGPTPDLAIDAAVDMAPEPDAAPVEPVPTRTLALDDAEISGPHAVVDGGVLLDPGGVLTWTVADPGSLADAPYLTLAVSATLWRVEDGAFEVRWTTADTDDADFVEVRGDADGAPRRARAPYADWAGDGFGVGARPPAHRLEAGGGPYTLSLVATGGGAIVRGAWLVDPQSPVPGPADRPAPPEPTTVLEPIPCDAPDCDDGAAITAAIAEAPEGPVTVRLAADTYTLRTPLRIGRDHVRVEGAGSEAADRTTIVRWAPVAAGRLGAIRLAGAGQIAAEAAPVMGPIVGASRRLRVDAPPEWQPATVWITADDFGEVPPVCVEGRDVERFNRHIGRLARVLSIEPADEGGLWVELDRALNLDVPAEANPRLVPARTVRGGGVFSLHLEADCPEALAVDDFTQAPCENAGIIDDDGVQLEWSDGAVVRDVSARAFGKFTISVVRSVGARVEDCTMDHPSAYGGGGQGYGVHLIYTGRTVVRGSRVEVARHGVVVDFGSTDAQVLDGTFRTMNQAHIDVHGEASYDTLIRGNTMARSNLGIIVGGGGRDVHCNDGPRHHLEDNTITDIDGAAITVSDYTRGVFVRSNTLDDSGILFTAAFGAGDVAIEHNIFGGVRLGFPPVQLFNADTGGVSLRFNRFDAHCSDAAAGGALLGAEMPTFEGNLYCP